MKASKLCFLHLQTHFSLMSWKFYFLLLNITVSRKGFRILSTFNVLSSLENNFEASSNISGEETGTSSNMTIWENMPSCTLNSNFLSLFPTALIHNPKWCVVYTYSGSFNLDFGWGLVEQIKSLSIYLFSFKVSRWGDSWYFPGRSISKSTRFSRN